MHNRLFIGALFFLLAASFGLTGGAQGVFEIPTTPRDRVVRTHAGIQRDPMWRYQNMDVTAFLREVRQATKKV